MGNNVDSENKKDDMTSSWVSSSTHSDIFVDEMLTHDLCEQIAHMLLVDGYLERYDDQVMLKKKMYDLFESGFSPNPIDECTSKHAFISLAFYALHYVKHSL